MANFKKSTNVTGSYKELAVENGKFVDAETGEEINVAGQLEQIYGTQIFSLKTASKFDEDLNI